MKRPQEYITGIEYWSNPDLQQNGKKDYLNDVIRRRYYEEIIKSLYEIFDKEDTFTLHELGCGWGTNLGAINAAFPNAKISANDIWKDAIDYVQTNRPYVDIIEMDTFDFIKMKITSNVVYDVIITNAHLIHFKDESLEEIKNLHKICKYAVIQENISGLEKVVLSMESKVRHMDNMPDSDYQYLFKRESI